MSEASGELKKINIEYREPQWQSGIAVTICQGGPGSTPAQVKLPSMRKKKKR